MYCIGLNENRERCNETLSPNTKFCRKCIMECMPHYIRYKKAEKRIRDYSEKSDYATVLKDYAKLKGAYSLRMFFKNNFVHSSAWDEAHDNRIRYLKNEITRRENRLIELAKSPPEELQEIKKEVEEIEESISDSSVPFNKLREEKQIICDKTVIIEDFVIRTPLEVLSELVGDKDFANFLMTYLYSIFSRISHLLNEDGPFILATPIFKIIYRENDKKPQCDTESLLSNVNNSSHFMFYYYKLFSLFKERSSLLYRFYRVNKTCYGLTFITNSKPHVIYIIKEDGAIHLGLRRVPLKDFSDILCIESNESDWNYHKGFNRDIHVLIPTDSKIRESTAIYRIFADDVYERLKEPNPDIEGNPWKRLFNKNMAIEKRRTGYLVTSGVRPDHKRRRLIF